MGNLLHAGLSRLKRDKVFWLCIAAVLVSSAGFMVTWCLENAEKGALTELDAFYFRFSPALGFFYAVFTCLFLTVEYSEGTIRNKLVVGHPRREVYLSHFLTVFIALLGIVAAWLIGSLAGVPFLGFLTLGFGEVLLCVAVIIGFTAAFSAIYTAIGMLNDRRTASVITISVWLVLALATGLLTVPLHEPEVRTAAWVSLEDGKQTVMTQPNPYYVSGIQRAIYELVVDFLPTGQADSLQNINLDYPVRMLLSSVFITVAANLGGMRIFQRKDLK